MTAVLRRRRQSLEPRSEVAQRARRLDDPAAAERIASTGDVDLHLGHMVDM